MRSIPKRLYRRLEKGIDGELSRWWRLVRVIYPWAHYCPDWDWMLIGHKDELQSCTCLDYRKYKEK